ncbi:MAG: MATE family efflux transporter [Halieaceae bacterium]|jgi:MATE family multidrug resistance protein|nr:MATE family efflux transporter [Halieaceae bacterium]
MNHSSPLLRETRALLALATPLFIAQLAQMGTGVVDTIMAGRYASIDLAAIAIGYNLWLPLYLVALGIMLAVTTIVAQHFGAGRLEAIRGMLPQAFWVAAVLGLVSAPLCYFPGPVLDQLSLDPVTYGKTQGYLKAVAFGLPGAALFQAFRCHIQGIGIVRPFAIASVIGFFANVPLNYIFIYGKLGLPEMGAVGCGWATAVSMWLGPALIAFYTLRSRALRTYLPEARWYGPDAARIREILSIGAPIGATFFFEMAVFSVVGLLIATVGNREVAAHQIATSIYDVVYMPLVSIGSAMATRMGHGIGRGALPDVKLSMQSGALVSSGVCFLMAIAFIQAPQAIASIYTSDSAILSVAVALLQLTLVFIVVDTAAVVTSFGLRAFKDTRFPFLVMTVSYWIVALPLGYYLGLTDTGAELYGALGFWWAMIVGVAVAAVLTAMRLQVWFRRPLASYSQDILDSGTV